MHGRCISRRNVARVAQAASLRDEYVLIRNLREQSVRQGWVFCCCCCFFFLVVVVVGGLMHNYLMRHVQGHPG